MPDQVMDVVRRTWGFTELRPLQAEAIDAGLSGRDSLVVMPTGGGKSLCYQVPPLVAERMDVVVSPLISLMKDQVDALRTDGYPAAAIHSGMSGEQRRRIERRMRQGELRLVFVAPERLMTPWFMDMVAGVNVGAFAIDEAHCISQWGHDFRPHYRQLAMLKDRFQGIPVHAFTATATPRVRDDIIQQLNLDQPEVLIGCFDRPNLVYRILPLMDVQQQVREVIGRHENEAVVVYCISRNDTEAMAAYLKQAGVKADHYHAGMEADERHRVQDDFAQERLDVVVATVAFGMGIDRSNVRCVIHAAMPKSIEHYQQETGRAGRDGLEAECVLFYSAGDAMRWQSLVRRSAQNAEQPQQVTDAQLALLRQMQRFCGALECRHKLLSEYFGQPYEKDSCNACDFCLDEVEGIEDATVTAQKILSCVARVDQRFGVGHVVDVLAGGETEMIRRCRHDQLSTHGLLREMPRKTIQAYVYQLVDRGLLTRTADERPILKLNDASWRVLRGELPVKLLKPRVRPTSRRAPGDGWEGVDRDLFEALRQWRRAEAESRGVAAFIILGDAVLRELARVRPGSRQSLKQVRGIGETRMNNFGDALLDLIAQHCQKHELSQDQTPETVERRIPRPNPKKELALKLFAQGKTFEQIAAQTGRAPSTLHGYLVEFITQQRPRDVSAWVDPATYRRVAEAARSSEDMRLAPIYEKLNEQVPYDAIRIVVAHLAVAPLS